MRLLIFANNRLGWHVVEWLRSRANIVGLVVHPDTRASYRGRIVGAAGVPEEYVFDGSTLRQPEVIEKIRGLDVTMGLSVLFDYILRPELLSVFPRGVLNLHPSYLPYNRGQYPNVWSIVEGTPAGVSLHHIDEGIDTGAIVARRQVPIEPIDTGETLYRKLENEGLALLQDTWVSILDDETDEIAQSPDEGTAHRRCDVEQIDAIDLDREYRAGELIDILRARTFPPHSGAWFEHEGRRVYMRLSLDYGEES